MPNSENIQAISVNVNQPLIDQEEIQSFLGKLSPKKDETIVPTNLLHKFLQLAYHALAEEGERLELQLSVRGLKVGYERKVSTGDDSYIVESHFVSNQDWRIDFEPRLGSQVQFLTQEEQESVEISAQGDPFREHLINLTEVCGDELYRIYPRLKDCLETHIYILVHAIKSPEDTPSPNEESDSDLLRKLEPQMESMSSVSLPLHDFDFGVQIGEIEIVLGVGRCPSCNDGRNKYKSGRMIGGICSAC